MNKEYLLTSESVTEGHPDKIADQISDAIIDELYWQDNKSKANIETMVTNGLIVVSGKVSTRGYYNIHKIARETVKEIGYIHDGCGFSYDSFKVLNLIEEESADISNMEPDYQGVVYGYASRETTELMPKPIYLANKLSQRLDQVRKNLILPYLLPEGRVLVTVHYKYGIPIRVDSVTLETQHRPEVELETLCHDILEIVIKKELFLDIYLDGKTKYFVNPGGRFVRGGPRASTGMTGRKVAVDTYGGAARYGGVSCSGKDPSHIERWGSYAARYVAKNVVAARLADRCEIQITYIKGEADPVSMMVETFGTEQISNSDILQLIKNNFDLKRQTVMEYLNLRRPIYKKTAVYGHFGREDLDFTWERTDDVENILKSDLNNIIEKNSPNSKDEKAESDERKVQQYIKSRWSGPKVYIKKYNIPVSINVEGNEVEGIVTKCTLKYLEVMIVKPFAGSADKDDISGLMRWSNYPGFIDCEGNLTTIFYQKIEHLLTKLYFEGKEKQKTVMEEAKSYDHSGEIVFNLKYIKEGEDKKTNNLYQRNYL